MAKITLRGNPINTNGDLPAIGKRAPDFRLTNAEMKDVGLADFKGKKKLIDIVVSLDTGICVTSAKVFGERLKGRTDVVALVVSADLPFAQSRACKAEGAENVVTLSMMRDKSFGKDYGVLIQDGPFKGILARSVVVLDENDVVRYTQLVPEIATDPDFDSALKVLG